MSLFSFSTITGRLTILVILALLPAMGIILFSFMEEQREHLKVAKGEALPPGATAIW